MVARHLVITGGTGYIGGRLVEAARDRGSSVTLIGRRNGPTFARHVTWRLGEPFPADALDPAIPVEQQALVHLAHDWRDGEAANVEGARLLFDGARACGLGASVFISSQSARPEALNRYGRMKWAIERQIGGAAALRVGLVYGGPRRAMYGLLCRLTRLPLLPMVDPHRLVQPIHLDEVVEGILAAADGRAGGVLALAGPEPVPFGAVLRALAQAYGGRALPILPIPVRLALLACDLTARLPFVPTVDRERVLGLAGTEPIASAPDLAKLGVDVRPLAERLAREPAGRRALLAEGKAFLRHAGGEASPELLRRYARAVPEGAIVRPHVLLAWREPVGGSTALAKRLRVAARLVEASRAGEAMLARGSRAGRLLRLLLASVMDGLRLPTRLLATLMLR